MTQQMSRGQAGGVPQRAATDDRTVSELVNDMSTQVSRLVRDELKLAQYELVGKGKRFGLGAGLAGAAGVLAWYGAATLIAALVLAFAIVVPPWVSAFVVGLGVLAIAGVLGLVARSQVKKATPPLPEQATESVRQDVASIKGRMHT